MAGDDGDFVGEGEEAVVDGGEELLGVAAGEVGAAYGAGEEGVSGEQEGLVGEVEADAAFGVSGGVEDVAGEAFLTCSGLAPMVMMLAFVEGVVGGGDSGGGDA